MVACKGPSLERRELKVKMGRLAPTDTAESPATHDLLIIAERILESVQSARLVDYAISSVEPSLIRFLTGKGNRIDVRFRALFPIAIGKAAPWMAAAFSRSTRGVDAPGIGVSAPGAAVSCPGWTWLQADHPIPAAGSLHAGRLVAELLRRASSEDLIVLLLSGGASSLISRPRRGVSPGALASLTSRFLLGGASIHQLNSVRRRLDVLKNGGIARLASPARTVALIISDVPGNRIADIGSGPSSGPGADGPEPQDVVRSEEGLPGSILNALSAANTTWPFPCPFNIIIGSNDTALQAAAAEARTLGYRVVSSCTALHGEARVAGRRIAEEIKRSLPAGTRTCHVFGGETSVTVRGRGVGGRNQELALSFVQAVSAIPGITMLSLATDGKDGTSPAAGALVSTTAASRIVSDITRVEKVLQENDSFTFLDNANAAIYTGPTGTNVADVVVVLVDPP